MPIIECQEDGKPGYQVGRGGPCFTYDPKDPESKAAAYNKAADKFKEIEAKKSLSRGPDGEKEDEEEELPIAAIELSQEDVDTARDLHVMRLGKLYDLSSGELLLDLDEEAAEKLAQTSQAMLDAGHAIPISFEHGIEQSHRGVTGADPRPYGEIEKIYFDQDRGGIYARKKWTKLGKEALVSAVTDDGGTAYRISPRVRFSKAYHPTTGEVIGDSYLDVISLTTLPRTSGLQPVSLSRTGAEISDSVFNSDQQCDKIAQGAQVHTGTELSEPVDVSAGQSIGQKEPIMADQKKVTAEDVEILLARGSDEAGRIFDAAGLEVAAPAVELARRVEAMRDELAEKTVELNRFKEAETARERAALELAVDAELDKYEIKEGGERALFRANLLSDDVKSVELARDALIQRGQPDKASQVDEAIEAAKARGALAADFVMTEEMRTLAAQGTELAVQLIGNIPAGNTVNLGEAAGSDAAGTETTPVTDINTAEQTLARIARDKRANGEAETMIQAWELARTERPELSAAVYGEK